MSDDLMITETAHSKLGASSMYRWQACPGSVKLSEKAPPAATSSYAEEGTRAHKYLENLLNGTAPIESIPKEDGMRDAVVYAYDVIVTIIANSKDPQGNGSVVLLEHRLDLSQVYPGCFGTGDVMVYSTHLKKLWVIDYKHGAGIPVDAIGNTQIKYYCLGGFLTLPGNYDIGEIETIEGVIIQPRALHDDGSKVRSVEYDEFDMLEFEAELKEACEATAKDDAPLHSGEHCRFCPAQAICPELHNLAMVEAKNAFGPVQEDGNIPLPVTTDQMKKALDFLPMLKSWIKAVDSHAYRSMYQGDKIPGYKLVEKRKKRTWKDEKTVANFFIANGIGKELLYQEPKLKTVAQIESALKLNAQEKRDINAEFVDAKSSGLKLVPESAPGAAIENPASFEFEAVSDDGSEE